MSGRSFALGFATAGLLAVGFFLGSAWNPTKTIEAGPKEEAKPLRAGYVSMAELYRQSKRSRESGKKIAARFEGEAKRLGSMKQLLDAGYQKLETATGAERAKLEKDSIEAQRKYEDAANRYRDEYQPASDAMIKQIHSDLSQELKRLADERGLDVIHAHPIHPARDLQDERWTEMTRIEHLLRSQAMVPIYLRDGVDLTAELVERLNARYDREDK